VRKKRRYAKNMGSDVRKFSVPATIAVAVAAAFFGWGVTWAQQTGRVDSLEKDVIDMKTTIASLADIKTGFALLQQKVQNQTEALRTNTEKIDALTAMVK
jgi:hypothetical protein